MVAELPERASGLVVERFGHWRETKLGSLPIPRPGRGEILIECAAAALNFQDLLMIEGKYQLKPATPFIPGGDAAGTITAVGPDVDSFSVGQRVAAVVRVGAFADHAIGRVSRSFSIPDEIGFAQAAACTSVFATVIVALTIRGQLQAGERVLISGAAGGVGLAGIQYARQEGAHVIALVSSADKEQAARRAGAQQIVRLDLMQDPREELRTAVSPSGTDGLDVVLDMVGGDVFDAAIRCLRPGGRLIVVGFASGRIPQAQANYLLIKGISVVGSALTLGLERHGEVLARRMQRVYRDVASGALDPFITATYPLTEFHRAAERIASRTSIGRIVLLPRRLE